MHHTVVLRREDKLTVCDSVRKKCWIIELNEKPVVKELSKEESERIIKESEESFREMFREVEEAFKREQERLRRMTEFREMFREIEEEFKREQERLRRMIERLEKVLRS